MSGRAQPARVDYLQFAGQFGADRILRKPFAIDEIINAVRELS